MEEYQWSSYQEYLKQPKMIENKQILSLFANEEIKAKKYFEEFHKKNGKQTINYELVEFEMKENLTDEEINICMKEVWKNININDILQMEKGIRDKQLRKLKEIKASSIRQLARVTGINRKMIERAFKNEKL